MEHHRSTKGGYDIIKLDKINSIAYDWVEWDYLWLPKMKFAGEGVAKIMRCVTFVSFNVLAHSENMRPIALMRVGIG